MDEIGMRTGITILLYGPPGTGKTESVYQLARTTGRDLYMISVSETKSMWFGESEKLIKQVFDEYRNKTEKSKITPILLFNEADAIFSTRKKVGTSAVDQTENAIQNVILQEMEDLKGILIATTNLTQNLDPAFERRFLYKICFEKPGIESRKQIWTAKIRTLKEEDALMLASSFELSGGQIENVSRKCFMHQVLYGIFPPVQLIMAFCREEQLLRKDKLRIGFEFAGKDLNIS
jgi:SpoVK/Ycf46/Vps4 family AAA+-type ATPase